MNPIPNPIPNLISNAPASTPAPQAALYLLGEPILRRILPPLSGATPDLADFVQHLFACMRASGGIGLAANQIGDSRRVAVASVDGHQTVLINPTIVESEGSQTLSDGCLSIPTIVADTTRSARIRVRTMDLQGRPQELEATGLLAFCLQHEIDHLNGRLFLDHLSPFARARAQKQWKQYLKTHPGPLRKPITLAP